MVSLLASNNRNREYTARVNGTALALCPDIEYFKKVRAVVDGDIVVVSWRRDVRQYAEQSNVCLATVDLEPSSSFFDVSDTVSSVLESLNEWFGTVAANADIPPNLCFWEPHPEGGSTSQRILDIVLVVRRAIRLLEQYNPTVFFRPVSVEKWISIVFNRAVTEQGIDTLHLDTNHTEATGAVSVADGISGALISSIKSFGYLCLNRVTSGVKTDTEPIVHTQAANVVAFQNKGSGTKHVRQIDPVMTEIEASDGHTPCAVCFKGSGGATQLRDLGHRVIEIEDHVPLTSLPGSAARTVKAWYHAQRARSALESDSRMEYEGVSLVPLLWPFVREFVLTELPWRLALRAGIEASDIPQAVDAIKYFGGGMHDPDGIAFRRLVEAAASPHSFHYSKTAKHYDWPVFEDVNDQYFTEGRYESEYLWSRGVSDERIHPVGMVQAPRYREFAAEHTQVDSRSELNLPADPGRTFFYAPQKPELGLLPRREIVAVVTGLFELFAALNAGHLVVKPHPNTDLDVYDDLYRQHDTERISLIDRNESALHCVNAADAVVTKYSTAGLEAILLDSGVVSVALDGREEWHRLFGDVAERFAEVGTLVAFLRELVTERERWENWRNEQAHLRSAFLQENLLVNDVPAEQIASGIVDALE